MALKGGQEGIIYEQSDDISYSRPAGTFKIGGWTNRATQPQFSVVNMGDWVAATLGTRTELPTLGAETPSQAQDSFPVPTDRRDSPPLGEVLPESGVSMGTRIEWLTSRQHYNIWETGADGIERLKETHGAPIQTVLPSAPPAIHTVPPPPDYADDGLVENFEDENVSIIEDFYETIDAGLGGILPGGVPMQVPTGWGGPAPVPAPVALTTNAPTGVSMPNNPGYPDAGAANAMANCGSGSWVFKKHCGEYRWVKQKRRRRKSLATKGDLKSLAALKGVLGTGKAFEVWIATHS